MSIYRLIGRTRRNNGWYFLFEICMRKILLFSPFLFFRNIHQVILDKLHLRFQNMCVYMIHLVHPVFIFVYMIYLVVLEISEEQLCSPYCYPGTSPFLLHTHFRPEWFTQNKSPPPPLSLMCCYYKSKRKANKASTKGRGQEDDFLKRKTVYSWTHSQFPELVPLLAPLYWVSGPFMSIIIWATSRVSTRVSLTSLGKGSDGSPLHRALTRKTEKSRFPHTCVSLDAYTSFGPTTHSGTKSQVLPWSYEIVFNHNLQFKFCYTI